MRILVLALAYVLLSAPLHAAEFSAEELDVLNRVSAALNAVSSLEGRFLQLAPDGSADTGAFYLRKPGRLRFEYDDPNPNLIISDGTTIAVQNSALQTTDRYPLVDSPLRLLLSENVDLASDPRIVAVDREPGLVSITARETEGPAPGAITITFADPSLELRQWEVTDSQGLHTLVMLSELRSGIDISARQFVIEELSPFGRRND